MFASHQPQIQAYASRSPQHFADVITFALLTIRNPIENVAAQLQDVRVNGAESRYLWGSKLPGYKYVQANASQLWQDASRAAAAEDDVSLLAILLEIPGLGLVKAGFVAQLAFGRVGCLDVHNLRRFDLDASQFRTGGVSAETLRSRIRLYIATCDACGGTEQLWDSWCHYVASLRPATFAQADLFDPQHKAAAEAVSALHVEAFNLDASETINLQEVAA